MLKSGSPVKDAVTVPHVFASSSCQPVMAATAFPKPFIRAPWRAGDLMVSRGNAGWTTPKSGHPCPCQNCCQGPPTEKAGRGSLRNRPLCPPKTYWVKGLNRLNWTEHVWGPLLWGQDTNASMWCDCLSRWLTVNSKTLTLGFFQTLYMWCVRVCMIVVLVEIYGYVLVFLIVLIFRGHSRIKQLKDVFRQVLIWSSWSVILFCTLTRSHTW